MEVKLFQVFMLWWLVYEIGETPRCVGVNWVVFCHTLDAAVSTINSIGCPTAIGLTNAIHKAWQKKLPECTENPIKNFVNLIKDGLHWPEKKMKPFNWLLVSVILVEE